MARWIPFVKSMHYRVGLIIVVFITLLPALAGAQPALRSDDVPLDASVLWLPLKYKPLQTKLFNAALAALDQPRCIEVKSGTVDLRQSSAEVPVFRILCKEASGLTYTETVTAEGYQSLTPLKSARKSCHALVKEKTKLMQSLTWLPPKPQASYPNEQAALRAANKGEAQITTDADGNRHERYQWDFDAASPSGESLHYRAVCTAVNGEDAKVKIKARR